MTHEHTVPKKWGGGSFMHDHDRSDTSAQWADEELDVHYHIEASGHSTPARLVTDAAPSGDLP